MLFAMQKSSVFRKYIDAFNVGYFLVLLIILFSSWYCFNSFCKWQRSHEQQQQNQNIMRRALKMVHSVDFEVFGLVQGVFFRKNARDKGKELGLKGWVMNTTKGTVVGTVQGTSDQIEQMKVWLSTVGSPMSKIEKCNFTNDRYVHRHEYSDFHIKKGDKLY